MAQGHGEEEGGALGVGGHPGEAVAAESGWSRGGGLGGRGIQIGGRSGGWEAARGDGAGQAERLGASLRRSHARPSLVPSEVGSCHWRATAPGADTRTPRWKEGAGGRREEAPREAAPLGGAGATCPALTEKRGPGQWEQGGQGSPLATGRDLLAQEPSQSFTHMHTHMHAYTCTCALLHMCMLTCMYKCSHITYMHAHTHARSCMHTYRYTCSHTHARSCTHDSPLPASRVLPSSLARRLVGSHCGPFARRPARLPL